LGGGDIVFPLLFSISALQNGIIQSAIIAFFALLGLLVSFWFFLQQKERRAIPALPPIALFSIIGYLVTLLFKI
jgi:presenilin-like A22 family membrane protease